MNDNSSFSEEAQAVAAKYLGTEYALRERYMDEVDAIYVYQDVRGGAALLVDRDGSFLYATSAVTPDSHKEAFITGRRTDPSAFRPR